MLPGVYFNHFSNFVPLHLGFYAHVSIHKKRKKNPLILIHLDKINLKSGLRKPLYPIDSVLKKNTSEIYIIIHLIFAPGALSNLPGM